MSGGRRPVRDLALVAAGGSIGAVIRVAFATWFPVPEARFPWTTFLENVSGAFLLAAVLTLLTERIATDPSVRLFVCTGALGAFTTYSTFAVEVGLLLDGGRQPTAILYATLSVIAGLTAGLAGVALALRWPRRSATGEHRSPEPGTEPDTGPGGLP
jgi:fluoride exporter